MFISKINIENYRLFKNFKHDDFGIPDQINVGSGLNVFVGENGCGKTTLLEALVLPILEFKSESFSIDDFNSLDKKTEISIISDKNFSVKGTMPNSCFDSSGFMFKADIRSRENKSYLSSLVVTDQLFIKADINKPKDNSPDLRVSVNNPFSGKRFSENDILFLDKNRLFQTKSGTYSSTRFDKIMEDFNYQYNKKSEITDLNDYINLKIKEGVVENIHLTHAISKFKELTNIEVSLDLIDNYKPFANAYFSNKKENHQQIRLSYLGSGYEMIFSLIYSFYMSQQSGKNLIILIDEPELHLHPSLQQKFVDFILSISQKTQIFLTTHSPLLVKQLSENEKVKIMIFRNGEKLHYMEERKLPYMSSNESNFLAFNLATEEYHNELYEELKSIHGEKMGYKEFDNDFFVQIKGELKDCPWKGNPNEVTMHTFIRNQIHHQKDNGKTAYESLKSSIEKMRFYL